MQIIVKLSPFPHVPCRCCLSSYLDDFLKCMKLQPKTSTIHIWRERNFLFFIILFQDFQEALKHWTFVEKTGRILAFKCNKLSTLSKTPMSCRFLNTIPATKNNFMPNYGFSTLFKWIMAQNKLFRNLAGSKWYVCLFKRRGKNVDLPNRSRSMSFTFLTLICLLYSV